MMRFSMAGAAWLDRFSTLDIRVSPARCCYADCAQGWLPDRLVRPGSARSGGGTEESA